MRYDAVAGITGVPVGTVRSRLSRGRAAHSDGCRTTTQPTPYLVTGGLAAPLCAEGETGWACSSWIVLVLLLFGGGGYGNPVTVIARGLDNMIGEDGRR